MIKAKYWKPEENESIEGVVIEIKENIGKYDSTLYKIKTENGIYNVWGSVKLDELFDKVKLLDRVYLKYLGKTSIGDYYMNDYELKIL